MASKDQKTEQPTQQRLQKARRDGRFPVSRDFISAVQFAAVFAVALAKGGDFAHQASDLSITLWRAAFTRYELTPNQAVQIIRKNTAPLLMSLLWVGLEIVALVLVAQLLSTGFGVSGKQLTPDFKRLNPTSRLGQMMHQNVSGLAKSLFLLPLIGFVVYHAVATNLNRLARLSGEPLQTGLANTQQLITQSFYQLTFILVAFGVLDLFRQRQRFLREMRMTKQEIRDELKDTEGNPQMKMRIRRLQRDFARRTMMKSVAKATAVVVNPTHYAVALVYEVDKKAVPTVVAKGKNYLAQLIRAKAQEHQVPIIENQPLAQALYKSVEIGQEIPPHLYRAVAEVLASIFRTLSRR